MERGRGVKITGGCHCGNIHYELTADVEFEELPVRICSCTFCQKHGNRYTSDPAANLVVIIKRADETVEYQFGSGTTRSIFCKNCGVLPFMKLKTDNGLYAIININTADQSFDMTKAQSFDYSGESAEQSIARREKKWIGNVEIKTLK